MKEKEENNKRIISNRYDLILNGKKNMSFLHLQLLLHGDRFMNFILILCYQISHKREPAIRLPS